MKKLSKLKLNQLFDTNLRDREMNGLKGGNVCTCSCYYENSGGSSSSSNMNANYKLFDYGAYSSVGCNQYLQADIVSTYCDSCTA